MFSTIGQSETTTKAAERVTCSQKNYYANKKKTETIVMAINLLFYSYNHMIQ
jgi:hypothetical protein